MQTFDIAIRGLLEKVIPIEAETPANAEEKAKTLYSRCEVVLSAEDHTGTETFCTNGLTQKP